MEMEMEVDPEIAAQMGFGSFGGTKKRKFEADDAFTNATNAKTQDPQNFASKANTEPVAKLRTRTDNTPAADHERDNMTLSDGTAVNLQALRRGVRNERGDMAYFLPSFLEDPWEKLKSKQ